MTPDFTIKAGDTAPSLSATLQGADLQGAAVRFKMRPRGGGALVVDAPAAVVGAALGTVRYDWLASDTVVPGLYLAEFEATWAGTPTIVQTFPNDGFLVVLVTEQLP